MKTNNQEGEGKTPSETRKAIWGGLLVGLLAYTTGTVFGNIYQYRPADRQYPSKIFFDPVSARSEEVRRRKETANYRNAIADKNKDGLVSIDEITDYLEGYDPIEAINPNNFPHSHLYRETLRYRLNQGLTIDVKDVTWLFKALENPDKQPVTDFDLRRVGDLNGDGKFSIEEAVKIRYLDYAAKDKIPLPPQKRYLMQRKTP